MSDFHSATGGTLSRRALLQAGLALSASSLARAQDTMMHRITRPIPHSGEQLPCVGLGTAVSFPSAGESQRGALKGVVEALIAGGGKLIDTASVYGNAETVIGRALCSEPRRVPSAQTAELAPATRAAREA